MIKITENSKKYSYTVFISLTHNDKKFDTSKKFIVFIFILAISCLYYHDKNISLIRTQDKMLDDSATTIIKCHCF